MSLAEFKKSRGELTGHQIETKELVGKTLTIKSMAMRRTKLGECCVVRFKEDPEGFYFGGKTTIDLYKDFQAYNVNVEEEDVKVVYSYQESKNGNQYVKVEVV